MASHWRESSLYGIVDLGYTAEERLPEVTRALLAGGAGLIQLRAKGRDQSEIRAWARELLPLCRQTGVPFIINDFIDLAVEVDADGVHLGQDDGPLSAARAQLAGDKIVGRSTHSPEQARAALAEGADYIGFGPLFPTPTKQGRPGIGLENIAGVLAEVGSHIPVFCIGGIKRDNLAEVRAAGARRVVVVSDLLLADDIPAAAREIQQGLS
ncbi:thiamine phosphate synthase [Roseibacillus ishigakijimensis]|uniref:Thiamine-phosphate synthase n=1 Tax=Roseibacillus ishigakijimensis TaxID=454146 RepID=A0A934RQH9_9BACT|nr:thiamine phosphate synthase [Roseibacillus ishigakijimensis]MBK1833229.1 thiamine phosphate synthase [Roseibacillus ishigakijimensis]